MTGPIKLAADSMEVDSRNVPASKTWTKKLRRKGGSVLEAALIVPILVTLGFGMAEFSYFFFVKHTLEGAAREGARSAIVPNANYSSSSAAYNAAILAADNSISAAGISTLLTSIAFTDKTTGATLTNSNFIVEPSPGNAIQATVTGTWSTIGVHPANIIPGTKQVIGTCVMRKEG